MELPFTKMVGAGNDFVVIDNRSGSVPDGQRRAELVREWCHRRLSVGADGVLLIEAADDAHFRMRYYNADGGEAEMCGNGGRCIARYAYLHGIAPEKMKFLTIAGRHRAEIRGENVKLGMTDPTGLKLNRTLALSGGARTVHLLNTGVPHAVEVLQDVEMVDVVRIGREIRYHRDFAPAGTNADFITPVDRHTFRIRTYERGVEDETLACGTGTTAAAIIGALLGHFESPVVGITRSGLPLTIYFDRHGGPSVRNDEKITDVYLEGNAETPFTGTLNT